MAPPDSSSGVMPEADPPSFRVAELRRIPATHLTTGKARDYLHRRVEENTFYVVGYVIPSSIYL